MLRFIDDIDPFLSRKSNLGKLIDGRTHVKKHVRALVESTSVFGELAVRDRTIARLDRSVFELVDRQALKQIPQEYERSMMTRVEAREVIFSILIERYDLWIGHAVDENAHVLVSRVDRIARGSSFESKLVVVVVVDEHIFRIVD